MCCSKEAGDWLFGKDSSLNEKYMFIPNAIDVSRFAYNEKIRKEYREQYGVEGKLVFGHVGRFHEAKNHLFLLDVFNEIHSRKSDAVLMLIGDGELRAAIEAGIHRLGIDRSVILTGVRSDVSNLMHAMDVFLFPSLWEGLPVTVVEAQAAGLPCLVSDNVTKDIDISKLVHKLPTDNVTEWADLALSALIRQDVSQEIKALGFDVEESANRLTAFYKRISEEYKSGEVYHSIG
jgi:glycosyltransferase involved in cell wall biosynthesis